MFGSLSVAEFLERHWQRAPILFSAALPGFRSPISPEELAGLACEDEVESRLVQGQVGTRFELEHGPFDEARFERLPRRDWTLLVQDVDKHVPEVATLLERFRFLPEWRVDDVMVSYAAPGGSVGPHTDQYDVFLVQARGRRRWQLSEHFSPALRADCDLKVLERFEPERELIAEPGDVLYLPPNVAHFGLALDEAMTFSVGFRAPDQRELIAGLTPELISRAVDGARFCDPGRQPSRRPLELGTGDLTQLRQLIRSGLALDDAELDGFIGRYLTRSKPNLEEQGEATSAEDVRQRLLAGDGLARRHGSRWALHERGGELWVFADGEELRLRPSQRAWLEPLLEGTPLGARALASDTAAYEPLARWLSRGSLEWQDDDDD